MREKNIPVYVMRDNGVSVNQINAVKAGVIELLQAAGIANKIKVYDFGVWRHSNWKVDGRLVPYKSIDWYIEQGKYSNHQQLYAGAILGAMCREPWQESIPHYDVMVLSQDMFEAGTNFVIGTAYPGTGTVLSTARWKGFSAGNQYELIKTETMHEVGHVFNLPNRSRSDIEQKLGSHCLNKCVMRQGMTVPTDWVNLTNDRLRNGALCPRCREDLRNYFK